MDPHQTRLIRLLENGCEDAAMLQEAATSCFQNTEQRELHRPLEDAEDEVNHEDFKHSIGPLDFSVEANQNMTALEIAVLTQNNAAVEVLLKCGAQPDYVSGLTCTCLCKVCYTFPGNIRMIKSLLEAGANPDATTNNDTASASCLIISVVKDNVEAVKILLEFGSDVSYEWKGQNALSMALDFNKEEIVTLLENHEYRRAQDNRWRRFTDRKQLEENRKLQQRALHKQIQLEDQRKSMLKKTHSKDPMMTQRTGSSTRDDTSASVGSAAVRAEGLPSEASPSVEVAPSHAPAPAVTAAPAEPSPVERDHSSRKPPPQGNSVVSQGDILVGVSPTRIPMVVQANHALEAASSSGIDNSVVASMSNMEWIVPVDDLKFLEPISSGAHGDVFEGRILSLDELVAIKRFPCLDPKSRECFRQEVTMLSKFRHENIVMFKGAVISPDLCCLLTELCQENLMERLKRGGPIPWATKLKWARDIAKAMNYLHTRSPQVVHRDLKSLNVLLDKCGSIKICDFGMARLREHTYIATQHISGSPSWMAPEVLRGDDFDDKSDVYAFGVIMWELMTRKIPWPDKNMAQLVGLVGFAGHRLEVPNPLPEGCPKHYIALMQDCFGSAPERPTFKAIRTQLDAMMADVD